MIKYFLLYPCGKKFEINMPLIIGINDGTNLTILPGHKDYLLHAKNKFQINNLKVIEEDVVVSQQDKQQNFISLAKKHRAID